MKRIVLFLATNLAVILVLSVVLKLFGLDRAMTTQAGIDYGGLLAFSAVVGFTGAIISLLMSKSMAKWSTGARVIDQPQNQAEAWQAQYSGARRKLHAQANIARRPAPTTPRPRSP